MELSKIFKSLDPKRWQNTDIETKIDFLKKIRKNVELFMVELGRSDTLAKGWDVEDEFLYASGLSSTVVPMMAQINATIDFYESILKQDMLRAVDIKKVKGEKKYDILVFPQLRKDKILHGDRHDYIRVLDEPVHVNPLSKDGGIIAVLGAGNYSSPLEIIKSLYLENCVVIHKPHPINEKTDKIWEKVFKPLIEFKAVAFCDPDIGSELIKYEGLKKIYFVGGSVTANKIVKETKVEVVSECGGNNPLIIVPGEKPWTKHEMRHQALVINYMNKLKGGAICARLQTIITCKNWKQRDEFLNELKDVISKTPGVSSYYPESEEKMEKFKENYPRAEIIKSEDGTVKNSDFLFITDIEKNDYALKHEAFTQIISEVSLDTEDNIKSFLPKAVEFANKNLFGSLTSCIIIDDHTLAKYRDHVEDAVTNLNYGSIGINTMPILIALNPYLTWGGMDKGKEISSGRGNFGNLLCYENVEKSISYSKFMSQGALKITNKKAGAHLYKATAQYYSNPNFSNMVSLILASLNNNSKK